MCGRFTLATSAEKVSARFDVPSFPELAPRYNIAPTQGVAVVRIAPTSHARELVRLRWGLIPAWADSPAIGVRMINARSETVASKPAFRSAFGKRRCLIPADGFFEWQKQGSKKQPFLFRLRDGEPFAFAGLWDFWQDGAQIIESCTILTTAANEMVQPFHDRMPVILPAGAYHAWLDPLERPAGLQSLLGAYPAQEMLSFPVSMQVNSPRNDDPECVRSLA